ncbi:protein kinase domain-containing protein [Magnetovibrio blakemorei]|uniref:Serine/threonine protein kinase n=2 Tax=Pseudomonadota TaxID=1224 RepID=C4RAD2_9PROT|nr:protein kinase family protein [Magnetovibrio blakemorei]ASN76815.1 serine/threonine protein kinase [Vibrio sp. MV-1]OEJ64950.1 hypothetical protein BEN30_00385 [Magnetovibrio blakemorei]CAV30777.1 Serine/threonine protein kinase [Magnetovibrio blakemorei]
MTFPIINDYRHAIKNAANRFANLRVKPILDAHGEPVFMAGNFAAVFKARVAPGDQMVAIKLFTRDLPQLEMRQTSIAKTIERLGARYLIDVGYMPREIYVSSKIAGDAEYPLVVMPWTEGLSMGNVVEKMCATQNKKGLFALSKAWSNLCLSMLSSGIAHGDLKHDNVLITLDGQLRLIDYDSMYVPQLKGLKSVLMGGASYQHPRRNTNHFDATQDHFSILVIALSLRALTLDPSLYEVFNTGENIILSHDDFASNMQTALIQRLLASPDPLLRSWTSLLLRVAASNSIQVPRLTRILKDARKAPAEPRAVKSAVSFGGARTSAMA